MTLYLHFLLISLDYLCSSVLLTYPDISHFYINSVKVLLTFDNAFYKAFNGAKGKNGTEYMNQVIALLRNAFKDKSMTTKLGTSVNIIGEAKRYDGTFYDSHL